MAITLRNVKGSELTHNELDQNFIDLRDGVDLMIPKDAGKGIKVDSEGTPTFPWHDLLGPLHSHYGEANAAQSAAFIGTIPAIQFHAENKEAHVNFHLPHDYVPGTDLYIHVHWAHNSATVTGGSVTWSFEYTYAKGFDQAAFSSPKTLSITQDASTTQYQHMVAETSLSVSGGSATQLDTDEIETDSVIQCRLYLNSNDITDSVTQPWPFAFFVDIHYQSATVGTKNKAPSFHGA